MTRETEPAVVGVGEQGTRDSCCCNRQRLLPVDLHHQTRSREGLARRNTLTVASRFLQAADIGKEASRVSPDDSSGQGNV